MKEYKKKFIELALELGVVRFGEFTLKSGRVSPYFFNSGLFNSGRSLQLLGEFYAIALEESGISYDMFFGPAYKGIPLVSTLSIASSHLYNKDVPYCFNRKEAKDHGEKGMLVGAPMDGRVIIVDDVISAGTSVRESIDIIEGSAAKPAAVLIALDRQEKGKGELSSIQELEKQYNLPVISIITLNDLQDFLVGNGDESTRKRIEQYRIQYGV